MRSSTAVGFAAAFGRLTSIPRYIIGAVSMKMRSSTRMTSTSGMMLISASDVPMRRWSPPPASTLNAIFGRPRELVDGARDEVQEVHREPLHLGRPVPHAIDEVVVADDGRNGGREAERGRDERLGDTRR